MGTKKADNLGLDSKPKDTEEMITRDDIEGSPFHIIGTEQGVFGAMGNYRITEVREDTKKNRKAIVEELKDVNWNRIIQVMIILIEKQVK